MAASVSRFVFLILLGRTWSSPMGYQSAHCPKECTCQEAALRTAPFVSAWMTSWGEDDLADIHPNDVLDNVAMTSSKTAKDAGVDTDVVGLHATCVIQPDTDLSVFFASLPRLTKVLSLLQAPGSKLTAIEEGMLESLQGLIALQIQGYAHKQQHQVSGFTPSTVEEMVAHKEWLAKEAEDYEGTEMKNLRLQLAEDALQSLTSLLLLDIQYVRLVTADDVGRLRRHSTDPVSVTTLLDLPLSQFLQLTDETDNLMIPTDFQRILQPQNDNENNRFQEMQKPVSQQKSSNVQKTGNAKNTESNYVEIPEDLKDKNKRYKMILLNGTHDKELVPYELYKMENEQHLAPFRTLNSLRYLRLAHARLDLIGSELFVGLNQLHTLTLEHNLIKVLPEGAFAPTPQLRHLSLAYNKILSLDMKSLNGLFNLLTLDLNNNHLTVLGPGAFPVLPELSTLRIFNNPITHILPDAFLTLNNTQELFVGAPLVSMEVHDDAFRQLGALKTLMLKNVTLAALRHALLKGVTELQDLTLHGYVPAIDFDAFIHTPHLQILDLSRCHLKHLSVDAFFTLHELKVLDLSYNELYELSPGTFDHLSSLSELYLHHNQLTTLPLGIFIPVPAKLIQLNHNPWVCSCELLQLRPTVTNKVRRKGYVTCYWNEKLATVCKRDDDRLVYDARVAPLCAEPPSLYNQGVFHAALRHLNCKKHHWDPRLLFHDEESSSEIAAPIIEKEEAENNKSTSASAVPYRSDEESEYLGWLPLTAFTPPPIKPKDLLEIAEREMLEEVVESRKDKPLTFQGQQNVKVTRPQLTSTREKPNLSDMLQNDQHIPKEIMKEMLKKQAEDYRLEKQRIKAQMASKMPDRQQLIELKEKLRKQEKAKIKAEMALKAKIAKEKKLKGLINFEKKSMLQKKNLYKF